VSESTKSVQADEASSTPRGCPDGYPEGGVDDGHDRVPQIGTGQRTPTVRELLAELAQLEDATRGLGGVRRPAWTVQTPDLLAALAREQEIIDELHRRCPDAHPATASTPSAASTVAASASTASAASTADENRAAGQAD
jgi:hypothetical protein